MPRTVFVALMAMTLTGLARGKGNESVESKEVELTGSNGIKAFVNKNTSEFRVYREIQGGKTIEIKISLSEIEHGKHAVKLSELGLTNITVSQQ